MNDPQDSWPAGRTGALPKLPAGPLNRLALALALVLVGFSLMALWNRGRSEIGIDFYQFWVVTQSVSAGLVENIYTDENRRAMGSVFFERAEKAEKAKRPKPAGRRMKVARRRTFIKTWSTPFLYTAFRPLASGDYEADYTAFQLLCLLSTALAIGYFGRILGYPAAAALLVLAIVAQSFGPLRADVRVGNVNQIQLGLLALFLLAHGRQGRPGRVVLSGIVLGAIVAFKPNLAMVVILIAAVGSARARWRGLGLQAVGFATGLGLAIAVSSIYFRSWSCWFDWLGFLHTAMFGERAASVALGNYSIDRLIFEALGVHVGTGLGLVLFAAVAGCLLWGRRRVDGQPAGGAEISSQSEQLLAVSVGLALGLLSAPLSFPHYYLLLLPLTMLLLRPAGPEGGGRARQIAAAASLLAFLSPQLLSTWLPLLTPISYVALGCLATLILFAFGLRELVRVADQPVATTPGMGARLQR